MQANLLLGNVGEQAKLAFVNSIVLLSIYAVLFVLWAVLMLYCCWQRKTAKVAPSTVTSIKSLMSHIEPWTSTNNSPLPSPTFILGCYQVLRIG